MWLSETEILRRLLMEVEQIKHRQEKLMSGVDDLKAAVAATATNLTNVSNDLGAVSGKIDTAIALIQQLRQGGGLSDADAETLAQTLTSANQTVDTAQTALDTEATKLSGA